ncbi:PRELI domain-containing protein 1, mitochondrial [Pituophis catenifer annectens]|uniref:PRELI domain-containing protein 1, mitochondrial n=1 Tax=Pituophis catenifer annectens TaxID=94852 RepID=UPI003993DB25
MGKYFLTLSVLKGPWDQVFTAFWQRYPNPYSKHVLTEDILHREVTDDQKLLSRRLLTKTNRMPRWAEHFFPPNIGRHVYILEDSIVDLQNRTMTTFTWNINHARLMVVEERCVYRENPENSSWTEVKREAWVSSRLFGVSRAIQEFGLARFKSNVTKTTKGFEYVLGKMQGEAPSKTLVETAKETALAVTEKAKDFAGKAATTKKQQYV